MLKRHLDGGRQVGLDHCQHRRKEERHIALWGLEMLERHLDNGRQVRLDHCKRRRNDERHKENKFVIPYP